MGKNRLHLQILRNIHTFKNNDFKIFQSSGLSDTEESGKDFPCA